MTDSPSARITNGPAASKMRRVATNGSRAKRHPQRSAVVPVQRTGVTVASSMRLTAAMTVGRMLHNRCGASRCEAMGEDRGGLLVQFPMLPAWPQRAKFLGGETSAGTDDGIMNGIAAASDHPKQPASPDYELGASRLTGDHEPSRFGRDREQSSQLLIVEVMQKQVAGDDVDRLGTGVDQKVENVRAHGLHGPVQGGKALPCRIVHDVLLVKQNNPDAGPALR